MWTPQRPAMKSWYIERHLTHYHDLRQFERGEGTIGVCEETPEGWILGEVVNSRTNGHTTEYVLWLIDDGSLIGVYRIHFDEWDNFPSMGLAWWIPF